MANVPEHAPELRVDNQLCFALYSTSLLMTKVYKPLLQPLGLTYPQYLVMLALWEEDQLTVGSLSARLLTDPGSLTPILKRLESEGLIRRIRSTSDERVVELYLTDRGQELYQQALHIPQCLATSCGYSSEQLQKLQAELLQLRANLQLQL